MLYSKFVSLCRYFAFAVILAIALWGIVPPAFATSPTASPMIAAIFKFSGQRPTTLGIQAGKLAPCPNSPNCVSSSSADTEHAIAPLSIAGSSTEAFQKLRTVIEAQPRTKIIESTDTYLYAEFTSALMGFVDDVEFYLDQAADVIQVRSASRLGESDLGVNRKRIEAIRTQLTQA